MMEQELKGEGEMDVSVAALNEALGPNAKRKPWSNPQWPEGPIRWVDPLPHADDPPRPSCMAGPGRRCPSMTMRWAEALVQTGHLTEARRYLFDQKKPAASAIRALGREDWNVRLERCINALEAAERRSALAS